MSRLTIGLVAVVVLAGCEADTTILAVDLRTDLTPPVDFDVISLRLTQGAREERVSTAVDLGADYLAGARIAEIENVAAGDATLELSLIRDGLTVITQPLRVQLRGSQVVTIVVTRSCRSVACPMAAAPEATACLGGECVLPECAASDTAATCEPDCAADPDCPAPAAACADARCIGGVCFAAGDDARCAAGETCDAERGCRSARPDAGRTDSGPGDAGPPADGAPAMDGGPPPPDAGPGCDCVPDTTETEAVACGSCGTSTRARTCAADCHWGAWSGFGACTGEGVCSTGAVEADAVPCGNCGVQMRSRSCNGSCAWDAYLPIGTCGGEGACSPGVSDTEMAPCDCGGSQTRTRTCDGTCTWGAFGPWTACSATSCLDACDGSSICPGDFGNATGIPGCVGGYRRCRCDPSGAWGFCSGGCTMFCIAK